MARLFDDASSEYLNIAQAVGGTYPFAIVALFNCDNVAAGRTIVQIQDKDVAQERFQIYTGTDSTIRVFATSSSANGEAATTTTFSLNTWAHATGIYVSATDRRALLNGAGKGTNATSVSPSGMDSTSLGAARDSSPGAYWSGLLAEVAIYDLSAWPGATDSDKADNFEKAMSGVGDILGSPLLEPLGLTAYWDLIRGLTDTHVSNLTLTASGTTISSHPNVIY